MATPTTLPSTFVAGNVLTAAQMNDLRGAFRILQVVSTTKTDQFTTTSSTYVDVTGLTATITPTATTSKVLVKLDVCAAQTTAANDTFQLRRDSTDIGVSTGGSGTNQTWEGSVRNITGSNAALPMSFAFLDSPASTSALVYKLAVKVSGGTLYVNTSTTGVVGYISTITVMEVSA